MTNLTAHRKMVLPLLAVMAIAGCATSLRGTDTRSGSAVPVTATTAGTSVSASPATSAGTPASASPATSAVDQQVGSIDNQLNTIDGQLNAANVGLSTSEGDPAQ